MKIISYISAKVKEKLLHSFFIYIYSLTILHTVLHMTVLVFTNFKIKWVFGVEINIRQPWQTVRYQERVNTSGVSSLKFCAIVFIISTPSWEVENQLTLGTTGSKVLQQW